MKQLLLDLGGAISWLIFILIFAVEIYLLFKFHERCHMQSGASFAWLCGLSALFVIGLMAIGDYIQ